MAKDERFVLRKAFVPPRPMYTRIPGQVPTKEAMAAVKAMEKPAPKFTPAMMLKQGGAYMTPTSVVNGLGLEKGQESSWIKFLETNLHAENEMVLRKAVMDKARGDNLNQALRRALLERSLMAYRGMRKSLVAVITPDELRKGEARGGTYAKRVPSADGKRFRYFYDEDKYKASRVAHISGEDASRTAIRGGIQKAVQNGGTEGCELKCLQPLVKRYGSKMVASVLDEDVKKSKRLTFKKGRLYASSGSK